MSKEENKEVEKLEIEIIEVDNETRKKFAGSKPVKGRKEEK